ncbi:MAG: hypothetical protein VKK80_02520, partial [Prochlorothrix sp.]|nr:hypothetical protein [Prochlorothrix sp.]
MTTPPQVLSITINSRSLSQAHPPPRHNSPKTESRQGQSNVTTVSTRIRDTQPNKQFTVHINNDCALCLYQGEHVMSVPRADVISTIYAKSAATHRIH